MNREQVRYALKRVDSIFKDKKQEIREKHSTPSIKLTLEEKLEALKKGKFKVASCPSGSSYRSPYLENYITFAGTKKATIDQKKITEETRKLQAKADELRDQFMLGESEEALKLLAEFERL